jgi:murein DD-endopeptidase MepM/ murein hydrolase activator NlpD
MLGYPLKKVFITQKFGERPAVYKPLKGHNGIDFRTFFNGDYSGKMAVLSANNGEVCEAGNQGKHGYGKFIRINHPDGSQTVYGHLSSTLVKQGDQVKEGQQIGVSGNTGFSSGPHLHFGYRPPQWNQNNGYAGYEDPLPLLKETMQLPYFEKLFNSPAVYAYDPDTNSMVPVGSGKAFLLMQGDYKNIKEVSKLYREINKDYVLDLKNKQ